ncbi:MAG: phosphotransferase [Egibacteraceae bacterium]
MTVTSTPVRMASGNELLGPAVVSDDDLAMLVRSSLGRPGLELVDWWVEPVHYRVGTPSTGLLARVKGIARDGKGLVRWSLFVKVLQSLRHWPDLHLFPSEVVEEQIRQFPWGVEADLYRSPLATMLPPGLRLPHVYRIDDLGDDRIAMWLEDVRTADVVWDLPRFRRAAHLLGRLAARRAEDRLEPVGALALREAALRYYNLGRTAVVLPKLRDDATWSNPLVAGAVDDRLHDDLFVLVERFPAILDTLDQLPRTLAHGDACPQNLLVPVGNPDGFVAIDFGSFNSLVAVGFDLGQLLVGLPQAGAFDPRDLPALHAAIVPPYIAGLREEGMAVDEADVRYGYIGSLTIRSALYALPLERLHDPVTPALTRLFADRARLARFVIDLGFAVSGL